MQLTPGGKDHALDGDVSGARLVGRDQDVARLAGLLQSGPPVVNVCGPAGVGKSTLVRAALARVTNKKTVVQSVELFGASGPATGWQLVARSLGVSVADADPGAALRVTLAGGTMLVLDDAESVFAVSDLVALAGGCPDLRIVVVTLARLEGVPHVELSPLDEPDAERLFVTRAMQIAPGFRHDADTAPYVRRICEAVEGLPLALELAAAQLATRPLAFVAREVSERRALAVLSAGRDGRASVRDCIEASCAHLAPSAAHLFTLVGIFTGPFSHEALVDVAGDEAAYELFDHLSALVDLRLVEQLPDESDGMRYRMPRLVRELARQRLSASGSYEEVAASHALHYCTLARAAAALLADARDESALPALKGESVELVSALAWLRGRDPEAALRLVADLAPVADQLGEHDRIRETLEALLREVGGRVDDGTRCEALLAAVGLGLMSRAASGGSELIQARLSQATELARNLTDPLPLLRALSLAFLAAPVTGDVEQATVAVKEGLEVSRAMGHGRWRARFEAWMSMMLHQAREMTQAAYFGQRALHRALQVGDPRGIVMAGLLLHPLPPQVEVDRSQLPSLTELLAMAQQLDDLVTQSHLFAQLATAALAAGDTSDAAGWVLRRLELVGRSGAWHGAGFVLMDTARIAAVRRDDELVARMNGAATPMIDVLYGWMSQDSRVSWEAGVDAARVRLGTDVFDRLSADSGLLSWDQALLIAKFYLVSVVEALDPLPSVAPDSTPSDHELTPRELQVLGLLVEGRRNKEIAAQLHVTPKTVMHHSVAIYRKLGVRGRAEAAVLAVRDGLVRPDD